MEPAKSSYSKKGFDLVDFHTDSRATLARECPSKNILLSFEQWTITFNYQHDSNNQFDPALHYAHNQQRAQEASASDVGSARRLADITNSFQPDSLELFEARVSRENSVSKLKLRVRKSG